MSRGAARVALVALVARVEASLASAATCHAAPNVASDRRASPSATTLTFATWNAKWLFDGVNDVAASPYANGDASRGVGARGRRARGRAGGRRGLRGDRGERDVRDAGARGERFGRVRARDGRRDG